MLTLSTRAALLAASLLAGSLPAAAQGTPKPAAPAQPGERPAEPSPSHLAAARDLIAATGSLSSVDEVIPALVEQVRRQGVTRPELAKDLDEVLKAIQPEMELQRQRAMNVATRAYAQWLTEPEMRELAAFFRTPTGAKYVRVQPDLVEDVISQVTNWSQEASEYIQTRVRVEMAKRGHQLQ